MHPGIIGANSDNNIKNSSSNNKNTNNININNKGLEINVYSFYFISINISEYYNTACTGCNHAIANVLTGVLLVCLISKFDTIWSV